MTKEEAVKFVEWAASGTKTVCVMVIIDKGHGEMKASMLMPDGNVRFVSHVGFDTVDKFLDGVNWWDHGTPLPKDLLPQEQVKWIKEVYPTLPKQ